MRLAGNRVHASASTRSSLTRGAANAPQRCILLAGTAARQPIQRRPSLSHTRLRAPVRPVCAADVAYPEGTYQGDRSQGLPLFLSVPDVTVARGGGGGSQSMGSGASLGAQVLERAKIDIVMPRPVVQGPKLDDSGSGGDMGNHNNIGGGDGSGGGGDDDDDYAFNDGEGGDGDGDGRRGEAFFRTLLPELFDRASLSAVLSEWFKTVAELPLIIRRAVEMGLFSSAQLTRFLAMDVRPNIVRNVARNLPDSMQSQLVGRLMADPGFVYKLLLETSIASLSSIYYEMQARGHRARQELDLVAINTLGVALASGISLWLVAPSRSYGALHKFPWQKMLHQLPNCVFDSSGPLRSYTNKARLGGWAAKMGELAGVGAVTGAATALLSQGAVALRRRLLDPEFEPSVAPPTMWGSSAGLAAFFAVNAHTRYQLLGGMDRFLFDRSNSLLTYLGITTVARIASNRVGEISRPASQGLPGPQAVAQQQRLERQRRGALAAQAARRQRRTRPPPVAAATAAAPAPAAADASIDAGPSTSPAQLRDDEVGVADVRSVAPAADDGRVADLVDVAASAEREAFGLAAVAVA